MTSNRCSTRIRSSSITGSTVRQGHQTMEAPMRSWSTFHVSPDTTDVSAYAYDTSGTSFTVSLSSIGSSHCSPPVSDNPSAVAFGISALTRSFCVRRPLGNVPRDGWRIVSRWSKREMAATSSREPTKSVSPANRSAPIVGSIVNDRSAASTRCSNTPGRLPETIVCSCRSNVPERSV